MTNYETPSLSSEQRQALLLTLETLAWLELGTTLILYTN